MGKILQTSIDEVLLMANIMDVAQDFLPDLKKKGTSWVACSPLTGEKTASLSIHPAKNIFNDFSANVKGGPVKYVQVYGKMTWPEAIKYIAKKYNIRLQYERTSAPVSQEIELVKRRLWEINAWASDLYERWFHEDQGSVAKDYMLAKGFTEDVLKKYKVGYAPDSWNKIIQSARHANISNAELNEAGLINYSNDKRGDSKYYDTFRHRIMFPITDDAGRVCGFSGRLLPAGETRQKDAPKYYNTRDTKVFKKDALLFGLHLAKDHIRKKEEAIILEGPTDVLSQSMIGVDNVVCSSGTAFTQKHLFSLCRYSNNFLVIFDGDAPGIKAADRAVDILLSANGNVQIGLVPDKLDPQEIIMMRGPQAMSKVMDERIDFIEFKARSLFFPDMTIDRKAKATHSLMRTVCYIEDKIKRSLYISKCSEITGVSVDILKEEVEKIEQTKLASLQKIKERISRSTQAVDLTEERELLKCMLRFSKRSLESGINIADYIIQKIDELEIPILETEDNYLYNIMQRIRVEGQDLDIEELKKRDPRAAHHAVSLLRDKFSPKELLMLPMEDPYIHEVLLAVRQGYLINTIKNYKEKLLLTSDPQEASKIEGIIRNLSDILEKNKSSVVR